MKPYRIGFAIAAILLVLVLGHTYAQSVEWICGVPEDAGEGLVMKGKNPTIIDRVTPNPSGKNFKVAVLYFKLSDDSFNSGDCQTQGWSTSSPSPNWMGQFLINTPYNAATVGSDIAAKPNSLTAYWYRMSNGNLWLYGDEHVYTGASITTSSDAASKASWRANNQAILQWYANTYDLSSLDNNSDGLLDMIMLVCRARAKYPYGSGQSYTGVADGDYLPSPITISDALNPAEPDIRGEYSLVNNSGVYGTDAYNLEGAILLLAHELGHQIWVSGHRNGLHRWNLMSGAGSPPPTKNGKVASAFEKSLLGWLNFTTITTDQVAYELSAMTSSNQAISIPVTNAGANNDYFVLEYRRNITHYEITAPSTCTDPGLGEGLLISYMRAGSNGPDIRPADGTVALINSLYRDGDATDLFPNGGITKITPYTTPNTSDRNGNRTGLAILNIQYSGTGNEKVKFDIRQNYWEGTIASNTTWSGNVYVGGNLAVNSGVTLTVSLGANVTISSGAVVTVQGTLSIASNVTITGGGTIVTSGSGKIYVTSSTDATASNNSRKLVRDSAGNYHLVFESDGEICYEKCINNGTALSEFRRLSSGTGSNKFPSIAERSGKLYVFWQRKTGTNTYDTHFRHFTGTSWDNIRNINTGISSNNDLTPALAASTPAASFEMMVVYRTNQGLRFRRSTSSTGATWDAAATVTSNTSA